MDILFKIMILMINQNFIIAFVIFIICIISYLCYKKKQYKIYDNNKTASTFNKNENDKTIINIFKNIAETYPKYPALKLKKNKEWKTVTYSEYYKKVKNFAQSTNYWLGSKINAAILGFNSTGWYYAHMGIIFNGGKIISINPESTYKTCKYIIEDSNIEFLIVENDQQLKKFANHNLSSVKLIVYYSPISNDILNKFKIPVFSMGNFMTKTNRLEKIIKLTDDATIVYPSNITTKNPKGIVITHDNIMANINKTLHLLENNSNIGKIFNENIISYLPLNNITSQIMNIYIPIVTASTIWFADKDALKYTLQQSIKEIKPTIFVGITPVWEKISNSINPNNISGTVDKTFRPWKILEKNGFDKCKLCLSINSIDFDMQKHFNTIGITIHNIYGMDETTGPLAISAPMINRINSVGIPITNVKISQDGEILVKGDTVFKEYNNDKMKTINAFTNTKHDIWFKTGDYGKIDVDGFLYVIGKKKT